MNPNELRVLILTASELESDAPAMNFMRNGYTPRICKSVDELCDEVQVGVGALYLAHEMLTDTTLQQLGQVLNGQPTWSHLPILLLLGTGDSSNPSKAAMTALESLGNVTVVESSVRVGSLVSSLRAALLYRQRQYQMRDLLRELEDSRREAVLANRAKSDFLANMSHEIRTPLGAVLGFAELLMENAVTERERWVYMNTIKRNGQLLSALINDILDLAKVEVGRIEIQNIEFSLNEMIANLVSQWQPEAARKGLDLQVQRLGRLPESISSDPVRLTQILSNVIGNAIKFTSHGAITVRCSGGERDPNPVENGFSANAISLCFEVEDTGIGIPPEQSRHLFQAFTQVDASSTRKFGGTGLGLILSRKLANALGGDLRLKHSLPGGGSSFEIHVVVSEVQPDCTNAEKSNPKPEEHSDLPLANTNILVVDDSLDNQMLIARILNLLGARVDVASDGLEGIEKAISREYDVILMDLQMPKLGGVEATRQLRAQGYWQPIVALTAHAQKEDRMRCLDVGFTDYLTKPIERKTLVAVLERATKSTRVAKSQGASQAFKYVMI